MDENKTICSRCGFVWTVNQAKKGRTDLLCVSCRAKPSSVIQYGDLRCMPWQGDFDGFDNPRMDGTLVLPGLRVCGHRDCINPKHVV